MRTLLLIRHAKSSHADRQQTDHDRPLNDRGEVEAPQIGEYLARHELVPEHLFCSTAMRARETAQRLAQAASFTPPLDVRRDLYLAGPDNFVRVLRTAPKDARRVAIVAHNPGLEEYLAQLTGEYRGMPTSAVAEIEIDVEAWSDLMPGSEGRLVRTWRPGDEES